MFNNKAYILISVLGFILVFMVLGAAVTEMVTADTNLQINLKHSKQALAAAEAGVQRTLGLIANNKLDSYCTKVNTDNYTCNGTLSGNMNYLANIDLANSTIEAQGFFVDSTYSIYVEFKKGRDFYSFAVNGKFDISDFSSVGKGENWSDNTTVGVKEIDQTLAEDMRNKNFDIEIRSDLDLPRVSDINVNLWKPNSSSCDYGDFSSDITISANLIDKNGDGKVVVCANNLSLDDSLIYFQNDLIIFAEGDINFTRNTTLKKRTGSDADLTIISLGKMNFDDNSNIDFAGADAGYNILLYAKEGIESDDTTGQWISISGNQNTDRISNVFILTPDKVEVDRDLIDDTAKTRNDVNFIIWADKGIESTNGGFDISGSSDTERNFSIIVADGDANFDRWQYTGSETRAGLTYEKIVNYCNSTDIPEFYRNIYCELKDQIENGDGKKIKIISWRVE